MKCAGLERSKTLMQVFCVVVLAFRFSALEGTVAAQSAAPAQAVTKQPEHLGAYSDWFVRAGLTCGSGATYSAGAAKPTAQCGAIAGIMPFFDLEAGVMGPQVKQSKVSGYLSTNFLAPLIPRRYLGNRHGVPLVVGGYTRMFETGHALDYGVAFAKPIDRQRSIQFEARDYWTFSNPHQHNVVFRVVWVIGLPD